MNPLLTANHTWLHEEASIIDERSSVLVGITIAARTIYNDDTGEKIKDNFRIIRSSYIFGEIRTSIALETSDQNEVIKYLFQQIPLIGL